MTSLRAGPLILRERVGHGGFGDVWRAEHTANGAKAAVKIIRASETPSERALEAEVAAMARLDHPCIAAAFDYGPVDDELTEALGIRPGAPWFCSTWVGGTTLAERTGVELRTIRRWLHHLLSALAHAHARGVLHLDLKPTNVMVEPFGLPILIDFGIAMRTDQNTTQRAGSPGYMAPEQIAGRPLSAATDLYALGCLAWTLLLGAPPFGELDSTGRLQAHLTQPLTPPEGLPEPVVRWLLRCLEKRPSDRFRHAAEARNALWSPELRHEAAPTPKGAATETFSTTYLDCPATSEEAPSGSAVQLPALQVDRVGPMLSFRNRRLRTLGTPHKMVGQVPLPTVGRADEQHFLWSEAIAVQREARPRLVTLQGPRGSGRAHLCRWLGLAAAEYGARFVRTLPMEPVTDLTIAWVDTPGPLPSEGPLLVLQCIDPGDDTQASLVLPPLAQARLRMINSALGHDLHDRTQRVRRARGLPGALLGTIPLSEELPEPVTVAELGLDLLESGQPLAALDAVSPLLGVLTLPRFTMQARVFVANRCLDQLDLPASSERAAAVRAHSCASWILERRRDRLAESDAFFSDPPPDASDTWRGWAAVYAASKWTAVARAFEGHSAIDEALETLDIEDPVCELFLLKARLYMSGADGEGFLERGLEIARNLDNSNHWSNLLTEMESHRLFSLGAIDEAARLAATIDDPSPDFAEPFNAQISEHHERWEEVEKQNRNRADLLLGSGDFAGIGAIVAQLSCQIHQNPPLESRILLQQQAGSQLLELFLGVTHFSLDCTTMMFRTYIATEEYTEAARSLRELAPLPDGYVSDWARRHLRHTQMNWPVGAPSALRTELEALLTRIEAKTSS